MDVTFETDRQCRVEAGRWFGAFTGVYVEDAGDWTEVKARWGLTMTKVEAEIVMDMLGRCENPPDVEVWEALESAAGEHKPEPAEEFQNPVYRSCEEAESAGSRGSRGARAEAWVTRRRWSRAQGTATGMEWCVNAKGVPGKV